jgi:hypothetical protein
MIAQHRLGVVVRRAMASCTDHRGELLGETGITRERLNALVDWDDHIDIDVDAGDLMPLAGELDCERQPSPAQGNDGASHI